MKKSLTLALGAMMLAGMAATSEAAINRADQFITVLTGPTSGIYFPIGGAFDKALKDYGYNSSSTATGASGENINAILTGQGELAIAMSDAVLQAYDAYGAFQGKKPAKNLKMLMSLWPNYVQLVTTEDSGIKKFEDLKGKRVGVGAPNSGVEVNARMMFEAHKMSYKDCKVDYLSYGEGIKQMMNGQCDAAFVTSGLNNATINELGTVKKIYIVPIEGEARDRLIKKYPCYSKGVIPKDVYGTAKDSETATVMNIMLVSEKLSNEIVYDIMDGINKNVKTIQASHKTAAKNIIPDFYLRAKPIPFHPGAVKWYKDHGYKF